MSDRVLALSRPLQAVAAVQSPLARQGEPAAPGKRQLRPGGLDQVRLPGARRGGFDRFCRGFGDARAWLAAAWRRHRSRQRIACLDPRLLRDIGVSYAEAEDEANKPFWRV